MSLDLYRKIAERTPSRLNLPPEEQQGAMYDFIDAIQYGVGTGAAGLAETGRHLAPESMDRFMGDARDSAQNWADSQKETMSDDGVRGLHTQIFVEHEDGSIGLNSDAGAYDYFISMGTVIGQQADLLVPGGVIAKGGKMALGKIAKEMAQNEAKKMGLADKAINAASMAAATAAMAGGMRSNQARDEVNQIPYDELRVLPEFRREYWDLKDENPNLSVNDLVAKARGNLAENTASQAWEDKSAIFADVAGGALGGYIGGLGVMPKGTTYLGSAAKGAAVEGVTEFGQGAATQSAVNHAIRDNVNSELDVSKGVLVAGLNEGVIGAGPGALGGLLNKAPAKFNSDKLTEANQVGESDLDSMMGATGEIIKQARTELEIKDASEFANYDGRIDDVNVNDLSQPAFQRQRAQEDQEAYLAAREQQHTPNVDELLAQAKQDAEVATKQDPDWTNEQWGEIYASEANSKPNWRLDE